VEELEVGEDSAFNNDIFIKGMGLSTGSVLAIRMSLPPSMYPQILRRSSAGRRRRGEFMELNCVISCTSFMGRQDGSRSCILVGNFDILSTLEFVLERSSSKE
jgi:hypothetical protein